MFRFSRKSFFDSYRAAFGALDQQEADGLEFLLGQIEADPGWQRIEEVAYVLATVKHETANTFQPIKEYRAKPGTKLRKTQDRYWPSGFYGRGYVMITWESNYRKFGIADTPDKALEPETAYGILSQGMRNGGFTTKKLSDFINSSHVNYYEARTIINGHDKALEIADIAEKFEGVLRASELNETAKPEPAEKPTINVEHAEKVQATTQSPIPGGSKDDDPKQATQGGTKSTVATILGGATGIAAAIGGWLHNNSSLAVVGIVCATVVILVWMFRQFIMDWLRMRYMADPTKLNVK